MPKILLVSFFSDTVYNPLVASFLQCMLAANYKKWLTQWQSYCQHKKPTFFWTTVYTFNRILLLYTKVLTRRRSDTGWAKKVSQRNLHITSSNRPTGTFSKFLHYNILHEICNKTAVKYPTSPYMRRYTTLWNIYVIKLACSASCGNLAE